MIAQPSNADKREAIAGRGPIAQPETVGVLRGASAGGDTRRAARIGLALVMVALAGLSIGLIVAGIQRNAHITELRQHGVPVEATVLGCRGLLGGSGSNFAGYSCWGAFSLNGQRYSEGIPGDTLLVTGSKLTVIAVADNPGIISLPASVRDEHASLRVFILPLVLLVVLAVLAAGLLRRRRSAGTKVVGGLGARGAASP